MKRSLLALGLGVAFLIAITWLGTFITSTVPHGVTAQVQSVQAGPYSVTLHVNPNPPPITQPATLTIQISMSASQQPVSNAHVIVTGNMEEMDMGTEQVEAHPQGNGTYLANVQLPMSGAWQVQIIITSPAGQSTTASFQVTTQ